MIAVSGSVPLERQTQPSDLEPEAQVDGLGEAWEGFDEDSTTLHRTRVDRRACGCMTDDDACRQWCDEFSPDLCPHLCHTIEPEEVTPVEVPRLRPTCSCSGSELGLAPEGHAYWCDVNPGDGDWTAELEEG